MEDIHKFRKINELKKIYRACSVEDRKESSAEHTFSCLMLADLFLEKTNIELDKLKVLEILLYHDLIEIEAGDTALSPDEERDDQQEREEAAMDRLKAMLPEAMQDKFERLFNEFEACKTAEAKFAKAVDKLDAIIHEMDYKDDWKGWSKEFLIKEKGEFFEPFPELKRTFYQLIDLMEEEGYFQ